MCSPFGKFDRLSHKTRLLILAIFFAVVLPVSALLIAQGEPQNHPIFKDEVVGTNQLIFHGCLTLPVITGTPQPAEERRFRDDAFGKSSKYPNCTTTQEVFSLRLVSANQAGHSGRLREKYDHAHRRFPDFPGTEKPPLV